MSKVVFDEASANAADHSSSVTDEGTRYAYSAQINKLLSLFINSMYKTNEVFMRELLSNSSDALDKARYQMMQQGDSYTGISELKIEVIPDKEGKTLTIQDTGIGMTKSELINNLGTIASSGTMDFLEKYRGEDVGNLIGQFGVGFYSSFLVAHKVVVISKSDNDLQYRWESTADGSFTVSEDHTEPIGRGCKVILYLKEDSLKFVEEQVVKDVFHRYSNFLHYPVMLYTSKSRDVEVEDEEAVEQEAPKEEADEPSIVEVKEDQPKKKKKVSQVYHEFERMNVVNALWTRNPEDVSNEEYEALFKHLTNGWEAHLAVKHFSMEGSVNYHCILFVPKRPPFDLFEKRKNKVCPVKLYSNHVFITDELPQMLPEYLYFLRGVVDCDELPLNVSRQDLQQNQFIKLIRKTLIKKTMDMVEKLSENESDYKDFYKGFGTSLKLGVHEDSTQREKLASLLRFHTSFTQQTTMASLDEYIKRMGENQKDIYYITAESYNAAHSSPFVETAKRRKLEVVYMVEAIDEYMMSQLKEYSGRKFVSLTKENVEFPVSDEEKASMQEKEKKFEPFLKYIADVLGSKVEKVKASWRMTDSPFCVVTSEYGMGANMERIVKAQALRDNSQMGYMASKKHLEVNLDHKLITELFERNEKKPNNVMVRNVINLLYTISLASAGFALEDPHEFSSRILHMVMLGLGLESDLQIPDSTDSVPADKATNGHDEAGASNSDDEFDKETFGKMEELD